VGHDAPSIDDLVDELRRAGQRCTVARRAVLEHLIDAGDEHLTADELASRVRAEHPAIHLSTVYRTLDALTEAAIITPARFADHPVTYHLTGDVHHHAVCTDCGASLNLPASVLGPVRTRLRREFGFEADPHHLTISGRCAECAAGSHP
jgi:Fur family ferric uptake transcriptional regulator